MYREKSESSTVPGEPTGRIMKTHWVRGHRRKYHTGVGRTEIVVKTIKPYLVNGHLLKGNLGDTQYRIKS